MIDKTDGKVSILTNNHVIGNSNEGKPGDPILQPGPYDIGREDYDIKDYKIGELKRFVEIKWSTTCPFRKLYFKLVGKLDWENLVDCALSTVEVPYDPRSFISGKVVQGVNLTPHVGDLVYKDGRTTCFTEGKIIDLHWSGYVYYGYYRKAYFVDQIAITSTTNKPFSQGGDSGSLVVDKDYRAVGLLFAGSDYMTIANKIKHVCELLKIEIKPLEGGGGG